MPRSTSPDGYKYRLSIEAARKCASSRVLAEPLRGRLTHQEPDLPAGRGSDRREVLLRLRQIATGYDYRFSVGFSLHVRLCLQQCRERQAVGVLGGAGTGRRGDGEAKAMTSAAGARLGTAEPARRQLRQLLVRDAVATPISWRPVVRA